MKLKDLLEVIKTWDKIQLSQYDGESFYPTYGDVDRFKEYFVREITSIKKSVLRVSIRESE
ncbi:hypothetical protein ACQPVP_15355 [Clostridium nigeriense]|uniref:hypothetical protein n=1 Tax=Clostridium nigeriense TaxID=1805470 RepID=UPI003D34DDF7